MEQQPFFRLDGKTALVTGGGQGIGEAICRRLTAAGASVGVFDRDVEAARRVAGAVGGIALCGDVTVESDAARAVAELAAKAGPVDILVNNAGIAGRSLRLWELTRAD